jgi:hypothetical protein
MPQNRRSSVVEFVAASLALAFATLIAAPIAAQTAPTEKPGPVASLWILWPKAGHEMQFEAAAKEHAAWRKQAGEGWVWESYQPVVGRDLSYYVYRSGEHHWADLDANEAWGMKSKVQEAFQKTMGPHVERFEHYIAVDDQEHSHWVPAEDYKYFQVIEYSLNGGAEGAVAEAIDTVHKGLMAGGWTHSYAISRTTGGEGALTLVFPYRSYAEMEEPKPGIMEVLAKGTGSAEAGMAAMQKFDGGMKSSNTTLYLFRPELSTPK